MAFDLKAALGEQYRDDITADEIITELGKLNLVDPSTLEPSIPKTQFDKTASELAAAKRELKSLSEKNLTEDERKAQAITERDQKIAELTREIYRSGAHAKLAQAGIEDTSVIDQILNSTQFATKDEFDAFLESFSGMIKIVKEDTETKLRADLTRNTPRPPSGGGEPTLEEAFKKMSTTEKMEFAQTNPEEFAKFTKRS